MPLADRQTAVIGFFKEQSGPLCSVGVPSERVQRREVALKTGQQCNGSRSTPEDQEVSGGVAMKGTYNDSFTTREANWKTRATVLSASLHVLTWS